MAEFYIKGEEVLYKLSNGKELIDEYENEKEKELKSNLELMEETINFDKNYKPYDFSFIDLSKDDKNRDTNIKDEIIKYFDKVQRQLYKDKKDDNITIGINQDGPSKDKWFILKENDKIEIIKELQTKPYCARVDYIPKKKKGYLQYVLRKNGKIVKDEFKIDFDPNKITQDEILQEYLK